MSIYNRQWTLFLDRDGVINRRIEGGYVLDYSQFEFLPGVLPALSELSGIFGRICIISNQQGVGKGLMTEEQLHEIHRLMLEEIHLAGGRIDAVYCCTHLETEPDNCRKPLPFMAFQAQNDFPEIAFWQTVMVGDSPSDMEFARNIGAKEVFIGTPSNTHFAGLSFNSLEAFVKSLKI